MASQMTLEGLITTPARATALELASGVPVGEHPARSLPPVGGGVTARAALEDAVLSHLAGGRCFTSFSGGRDSSAVLALATFVARREGLAPPVPITIRYSGAVDSDETAWQELIMAQLRLDDWVRLDVDDELDYLGPRATSILRRHGVMWPPYFHYEHALLSETGGGVLLTGHDGDGIFGSWPWGRLTAVLGRQRRPGPGDLARAALAMSPPPLRQWEARRHHLPLGWLRPELLRKVEAGLAAERARQPVRWDRWVPWLARRRSIALGLSTIDVLADDCGARAVHPLLDPSFLAALAREGGSTGLGERTDIMKLLFADVLPTEMVRRKAKSSIGGGFWRAPTKAFAAGWDGRGVDEALVDPVGLREAWTAFRPKMGAVALLQGAWLATVGGTGPPEGGRKGD